MQIVVVIVLDWVNCGECEDLSGLVIEVWLKKVIVLLYEVMCRVILDGFEFVCDMFIDLCDQDCVDFVFMIGGIGLLLCDEMFEVMCVVLIKEMLGFGDLMCCVSFEQMLIVIFFCQMVGMCGKMLIVNLLGKLVVIDIYLDVVFLVIFYCIDFIGNGCVEMKLLMVMNCCFVN